MDEARAGQAVESLELSVLSIPGVFENIVSRLSAAEALRLSAACKALLSLPLPREHAFTAALRACPPDVGSTAWPNKSNNCPPQLASALERCVRSLVNHATGALSLDGCDERGAGEVLARLCAAESAATRIRSLDVLGACQDLLGDGDEQDSDGDDGGDSLLTADDLVSAISGGAWPRLSVEALSRRRKDAERAARTCGVQQQFDSIALRATLASPPLRCVRTLETALAARFRRGAAAGAGAGPAAVRPARRLHARPLARLETLVAWAPGDARCVPFTPPQARELVAACSELPAFRSAHVLIYSIDASEPGHSARDALEAAAALPPASRVALHLRGVDDGEARDVAGALDADEAGCIALVGMPPGGEPWRLVREAARRRGAAGRPVVLKPLRWVVPPAKQR